MIYEPNFGPTPLQLDYLFASVDNPGVTKVRGILSFNASWSKRDRLITMILNQINTNEFPCYTKSGLIEIGGEDSLLSPCGSWVSLSTLCSV